MLTKGVKQNLPARVGLTIVGTTFLLVLIASIICYLQIYEKSLKDTNKSLMQLMATVEQSSAVACYLDNVELAGEVVTGLASNDIVAGAALSSVTGLYKPAGKIVETDDRSILKYPLKSPFMADEQVGSIMIKPNSSLIESEARKAAMFQMAVLIVYSIVIVAIVVLLVYRLLTRPLTSIASDILKIEPGSDQRLGCPEQHQDNEIGQLVKRSNRLLDSVSETLERERGLRLEVENLGKQLRLIFENATSGVALFDYEGRVVLVNDSFRELLGEARYKLLTRKGGKYFVPLVDNPTKVRRAFIKVLLGGNAVNFDLKFYEYKGDSEMWLHCLLSRAIDDEGTSFVSTVVYDVSSRAEQEQRLKRMALYDPLTNIFNRRSGDQYIQDLLAKSQRQQRQAAFLLIDLDYFKEINDTHGHDAGDIVLVETSRRLEKCVRRQDLVIRWGGDEFLIVLMQGHGELNVEVVIEKILTSVREEIFLNNGHRGKIGASIGVSLYPEHGQTMEDLLTRADIAMYHVKQKGKDNYCIFEQSMMKST